MKILFFHRWAGVHGGGTETHLKELAFRFAKRSHEVHILTRAGKALKNTPKNIKIHYISKNLFEYDHSYVDWRIFWHTALYVIKSLIKLFNLYFTGERFDVLSIHFATEAVVARIFRFLTRTPYVFILEGYTNWEAEEAKRANAAIAISRYEAKRCERENFFSPYVVPIGVDLERFFPTRERIKKKNFTVLTVCRLEPRKDLITLFRAAKIIQKKDQDVKFQIAGTGIDELKLKTQNSKLKIEKTVEMLGFVADEDLPELYRRADLFILPTYEEGFGIVLIEAMASGLSIISNAVGAVPEVAGEVGILLPARQPQKLATAILRIKKDKKLEQKMRRASLERAKEFDWEKIISQYEAIYQSIS